MEFKNYKFHNEIKSFKSLTSILMITIVIFFFFFLIRGNEQVKNSNKHKNNNKEKSNAKYISKPQFIEFYNKFFVESNPVPEVAELYKEHPDFFRQLAEKLVKTLPDTFPLDLVKNILNMDKDEIMKAIEEIKASNNQNAKTEIEAEAEKERAKQEELKLKKQAREKAKAEAEAAKKAQAREEQRKQQHLGYNEKLKKEFYISMILNNAWNYEDIKTQDDEFYKKILNLAIFETQVVVPEEFDIEDIHPIGKKVEEKYREFFKTIIKAKILSYFSANANIAKEKIKMLAYEIDNNEISFKNLKSKILYILYADEKFKDHNTKEGAKENVNKFSMEASITIEDL